MGTTQLQPAGPPSTTKVSGDPGVVRVYMLTPPGAELKVGLFGVLGRRVGLFGDPEV